MATVEIAFVASHAPRPTHRPFPLFILLHAVLPVGLTELNLVIVLVIVNIQGAGEGGLDCEKVLHGALNSLSSPLVPSYNIHHCTTDKHKRFLWSVSVDNFVWPSWPMCPHKHTCQA